MTTGVKTSTNIPNQLSTSTDNTITIISPVITSANITAASCTPNTLNVGVTTTCTATFSANKSGTIAFTTSPNTGSCTTPAIVSTVTTASCSFTVTTVGNSIPVTATASGGGTTNAGTLTVPTTIATANLQTGTCITVQLGTTTTCEYRLTGNGANNYSLPSGGITVTVPGSTTSPACTIANNGTATAKLVCANAPTTGSTVGSKNVPTSLGATPTASLLIDLGVLVVTDWNTAVEEGLYYGNNNQDSSIWATRDIIFDSGLASSDQNWETLKVNYSGESIEFEVAGSDNCISFGSFAPISIISNTDTSLSLNQLLNQKCIKLRIKMRSKFGISTPTIISAQAKWKNWVLVPDVLSSPTLILPNGVQNSRIFKLQASGNCKIATSEYSASGTSSFSTFGQNIASVSKPTNTGAINYSSSFGCSGVHYINNNSNMSNNNFNFIFQQDFNTIFSQRIINLQYQ